MHGQLLCNTIDNIPQVHIPSDESLGQGQRRSPELLFYMEQPR